MPTPGQLPSRLPLPLIACCAIVGMLVVPTVASVVGPLTFGFHELVVLPLTSAPVPAMLFAVVGGLMLWVAGRWAVRLVFANPQASARGFFLLGQAALAMLIGPALYAIPGFLPGNAGGDGEPVMVIAMVIFTVTAVLPPFLLGWICRWRSRTDVASSAMGLSLPR